MFLGNRSATRARKSRLYRAIAATTLLYGAQLAYAQDTTVPAATVHACAEDQYKSLGGSGTLGCTAGDLAATVSAQVPGNTVGSCPLHDPVNPALPGHGTVDVLISLTSGSADRYDVGVFIGEDGNSAIAAGGTCSVATFPTSPTGTNVSGGKWFNGIDNNACGDYNKNSTSDNLIQGVKVRCTRDPVTKQLVVPFAIVYLNNDNGNPVCTGVNDVTADNTSKCTHNDAAVISNVFVTTSADPECGKSMSFDNTQNLVTTVITITNNSADPNFQDVADGSSFSDDLSAFGFTNITPTCTNTTGGASCPTDLAVSTSPVAGIVTGSIATFPFGSSVEITITANNTPGDTSNVQNSVTLTTPPSVLPPLGSPGYTHNNDGTSTFAGACTAAQQLPVKVQSFEVK